MPHLITTNVSDIYERYRHDALGKLKCPNGGTKLQLSHILKPVFETFKTDQIIAFIGFGSAFRYPRIITRMNWRGRPKQVLENPVRPKDFDFTLIIRDAVWIQKITSEPIIKVKEYAITKYSHYGSHQAIQHGPSQIFILCPSEMKRRRNDTNNWVVQSILQEGVLLFGEQLPDMHHRRVVQWDNGRQKLKGRVKDGPITTCSKCNNQTRRIIKYCPRCGNSDLFDNLGPYDWGDLK